MPTTEKPGLTRDAIKYLAIFTMLLNHIANVLLPENTILWEVFSGNNTLAIWFKSIVKIAMYLMVSRVKPGFSVVGMIFSFCTENFSDL